MNAWAGTPQRRRVGVVGLGAGALAAYAAPGERWTFFEIDPAVVDISRDRGVFTYLRESPAAIDVVLGDARRSLAAVPDASFGMLVLDAFSSDAVPAHLVTREAFALYLRKLAPAGIIVVHVSNRYLDLEPVIAGAARASGLLARIRLDEVTAAQARAYKSASDWMVLARTAADLAPLAGDKRWIEARNGATDAGWTDDRSNVWRALRILRH
jgi:spermidine synthase